VGFKTKLHSTLGDLGPHGEAAWQTAAWVTAGTRLTIVAFAPNTLRTLTFPLASPRQFESIAIRVDTAGTPAGAKARVGIYQDNGLYYPGRLLFASAELAVDLAGAKRDDGLSIGLAPGIYHLAIVHNATTASPILEQMNDGPVNIGAPGVSPPLQGPAAFTGWDIAFAYAALPDPYPAGANNVSPSPRIFLKTA
jgi:hypothetical protein